MGSLLKYLMLNHGLSNWISSRKSDLSNAIRLLKQDDQVNLGSQDHSKTIFISKDLSLTEREELIALVREYIDVFAWNYEDMLGHDPQVAMHRLNIKPDIKPVKQQER